RVRLSASTSNLGGGFDCVGIAVDRHLELVAHVASDAPEPVTITRRGTATILDGGGAPTDDLIYRGFAIACRAAEREVPNGVVLEVDSSIPVGRGLGSSAAALLAGAAAANALLELGLPDATIG